jgi:hypothetical protein
LVNGAPQSTEYQAMAALASPAAESTRESAAVSVNVRSFKPGQPEGGEFLYGLRDLGETTAALTRLSDGGYFTIVNETVDVTDGGVSGVVFGDVIEFAPDDTPRAVDKSGILFAPRDIGERLIQTVYGFEPDLHFPKNLRTEFSIHPEKRGYADTNKIVWELSEYESFLPERPMPPWPNR